jgi:hypothetical protein
VQREYLRLSIRQKLEKLKGQNQSPIASKIYLDTHGLDPKKYNLKSSGAKLSSICKINDTYDQQSKSNLMDQSLLNQLKPIAKQLETPISKMSKKQPFLK